MNKRGKSLIIAGVAVFFLIFLTIGFVIADNSVSDLNNYEDDYKTAVFDNAKATIITPITGNKVEVGEDVIVIIIEGVNFPEGYVSSLGDVEVINMKNGIKETKQTWWKYAVYGDVLVNDYGVICSEVYNSINQTNENICKRQVVGSHTEKQIIGWRLLTSQDYPKGNLTLGLATDVKEGDYYDGIPIMFDKKINRWASWEAIVKDWSENSLSANSDPGSQSYFGAYLEVIADSSIQVISFNVSSLTDSLQCGIMVNPTEVYMGSFSGFNCSFADPYPTLANGTKFYAWTSHNNDTSGWTYGADYSATLPTTATTNVKYLSATYSAIDWSTHNNTAQIYQVDNIWTRAEIMDSAAPSTTTPIIIPSIPKSNQNLQCNATLIDNMQTNLTAYWKWYKNDILNLSGNTSVINGTNSLITTLNSGNTTKGENWTCEIAPYDGTNSGNAVNSTSVTILNSAPTQSNPLLSTPSASHPSNENLTCENKSTGDADNDAVVNVYNWVKNGVSLLSLSLAFEINANDYSGNGNDGSINGATFTTGKLGNALNFDGGDSVLISDDNSLDFNNKKTWEIWFKRGSTGAETIFDKGNGTESNYKLEFLSNNLLKFSYSLAIGDVVNNQDIDTESEFNNGDYVNTYYNTTIGGVRLSQTLGNYTSEIFNAGSIAEWNNLSWSDNVGSVLTLVDVAEGIYKSINQGTNWTLINTSYGGLGSAVEIIESIGGILYIVNDREEVWRSADFGTSWTEQIIDFNDVETTDAVTMTGDESSLYIIESDEDVWMSSNNGTNWSKINDDLDSGASTADIKGATIDSLGNIYAVANDAKVYKSSNNGVDWGLINSDFNGADGNSATDISINAEDNLYILNLQEVWESSNAGVSWTKINTDFNGADGNNGITMAIDINNFFYIVDASEDVYRSTDSGISWNLLVSNLNGGNGNVMSIVAYDQPTAKFQVKSCDDSICSGENFIGLDGTISSYYLDSPENLNVSNNQYFQFITYFETYDTDYSPEVYGVNIDYTTQSTDLSTDLTSTTGITDNNWHLATITFSDESTNNFKFYLDKVLEANKTEIRTPGFLEGSLTIGDGFNGSLDEFKIYEIALSPEQTSNNYNLGYNLIVSQETSAGETYMCSSTPNDGEEDGATLNSNELNIMVNIVFNVTDSYSDANLNGVTISCNSTNFSQLGDTTNTYGPYGFEPGNYECNFTKYGYYSKSQIFLANNDEIIIVKLSEEKQLTVEEHTWLEAIYNCLYSGDCSLYNLLLEVNQTVSNIWENTKPTDESVITKEDITNKIVDSTHNLTIDYSVYVPIKAGYSLGTYLPIRIGYWFLNSTNTTCYNQGDKPIGVEDPYCQPLIIETLGPMGGIVNFTVKLHPELSVGNYSIKRIIDIDPNNVWINYGQDMVGSFIMAEGLDNYGIAVEKTGENNPNINTNNQQQSSSQSSSGSGGSSESTTTIIREREIVKEISKVDDKETNQEISAEKEDNNLGITGGVIGTFGDIFSGWQIVAIIGIIGGILITLIVSKTIIKLKKR